MIGQRGVPATFGGVEHHVEELGARLVERGHDVTVFARPNYSEHVPDEYRGMRVRTVRTVGTKHLDAIVHSMLSTLAAIKDGHDVYHYHAQGPGVAALVPRLLRRGKIVQTIHGLDSQRAKWGRFARTMLQSAEWLSARVPDATVVVSEALAAHYRDAHRRDTTVIPNGVVAMTRREPDEIRHRFGLEAGGYVLFVGRFVPEKAPDLLIRAFGQMETDHRLVLAGGSSFTDAFVSELHSLAAGDPRVVFTGYVYGDVLAELYSNAAAFVLPSRLEGLPLTLLEAAAYGTPIVASDIPPHLEVIEEPGPGRRVFTTGDRNGLVAALTEALEDPATERAAASGFASLVTSRYRWDDAAEAIEAVYQRVTAPRERV